MYAWKTIQPCGSFCSICLMFTSIVASGPINEYEALTSWLHEKGSIDVEAIVGVNDVMALYALRALQVLGIRVPEDIAVAGFNDIAESRNIIPLFY